MPKGLNPRRDTEDKLLAAKARMEISEMPEEARAANIQPMNFLERALQPNALAITWPWGRVGVDVNRTEESGQNLEDILAHELTHVKQQEREGMFKTFLKSMTANPDYFQRPYEIEALLAESSRPIKRSNILLPKEKVNAHSR